VAESAPDARPVVGQAAHGHDADGLRNLQFAENIINHHILGIHHVNETVPRDQWIWWDVGFLIWGAAMLVGGWVLLKKGQHSTPD
jgi:uncharacterized membrane protein